jgi:hypothetical protein
MNTKKNKNILKDPTVAPGLDFHKFGDKATEKDIKKGNSTKVTRAFLDENDPS